MSKPKEPVESYKEGKEILDKGIDALSALNALDKLLYEQTKMDSKLSDLVKVNPDMTLKQAIQGIYKGIKLTYDKMVDLYKNTDDPNLAAYINSYINKIKPLLSAYVVPLASVLQTATMLKILPLQKEIEDYQAEIKEYAKDVKELG